MKKGSKVRKNQIFWLVRAKSGALKSDPEIKTYTAVKIDKFLACRWYKTSNEKATTTTIVTLNKGQSIFDKVG